MTGEAVVLDLQTAKLPSRALAITLDLLVEFAALFLVSLTLSVTLIGLDGAALAATLIGLLVFFLVAVPVMVETFTHGRSLGKAALGLRVVRTDGGPVRFRHSLVRGLVGFMELVAMTGVPAVITSAVNVDGKRLGDIFAGTVVVRERAPGGGRRRCRPCTRTCSRRWAGSWSRWTCPPCRSRSGWRSANCSAA